MPKKIRKAGGVQTRRSSALKRLEDQLKLGSKPKKKGENMIISHEGFAIHAVEAIPLTDKDKQRIEKEIETLKSRL